MSNEYICCYLEYNFWKQDFVSIMKMSDQKLHYVRLRPSEEKFCAIERKIFKLNSMDIRTFC